MKRNPCYVLKKLDGTPYLMPCGQSLADIRRGVQLNDTGVYLWRQLAREKSFEELLAACSEHYGIDPAQRQGLEADLASYLQKLSLCGALYGYDDEIMPVPSSRTYLLSIGGLSLKLQGPDEAVSDRFLPFLAPHGMASPADQTVQISTDAPRIRRNGTLLIRDRELMVIDGKDRYILLFPCAPGIREAQLSKDGNAACFYCIPPFTAVLRQDLFHAVRLVYLYMARLHGVTAIHSASLLYRGRAWLFSGSSGTGKSTHTDLWNRLYRTPLINGDLNLIAIKDGNPVVHGLPWCGTSEICDAGTYPLGGIILLRQAPDDRIEEVPRHGQILMVQQRMITPAWTPEMLKQNIDITQKIISDILVCRLHCTPGSSAPAVMRERIDRFLEEKGY